MPGSLNCFRDNRELDTNVNRKPKKSKFFLKKMHYPEFENILTPARMSRYLNACNGQTKKAMTLYRLNLKLSQELFTAISCFEVALRNAIDELCGTRLGADWILHAAMPGGIFDNEASVFTNGKISGALGNLNDSYSHNKLVAELSFGFWRYMFAPHQFTATGKTLLKIFPAKPLSTPIQQFNHNYVFKQLREINHLRNRIAHHESICFLPKKPIKSTHYARINYSIISELLHWMAIDKSSFLYGLDHILSICDKIDAL